MLKNLKKYEQYINTARLHRNSGNFDLAIENYKKALELAGKLKDNKQEKCNVYIKLGYTSRLKNQYKTAIEYHEKALEIAKERGDKNQEAQAYLELGVTYTLNNQHKTAIECDEKALVIAKERGDKLRETRAYLELGGTYRLNNQYQTAIEYSEKALAIAKERGNKLHETWSYIELGMAYSLNNQCQTAIKYYEKSLVIAKEQGNKREETRAYLELGMAYRLSNQYQTAIEYYENALVIAKERGDKSQETRAYLELGMVYCLNNRYEKAIEYSEKALVIGKEQRDARREIEAQLGLGSTFQLKGQVQEAITHYKEALEVANAQAIMTKRQRAQTLMELGDLHDSLDENQMAKECYEEVLMLSEMDEDKDMKQKALNRLEKFNKPQMITNVVDDNFNNLQKNNTPGEVRTQQSQCETVDNVEKCISEERNISHEDQHQQATQFQEKANIFASNGDYEKSKEFYQEALQIAKKLGDKFLEGTSYLFLASVCSKDCDYKMTIEWYEQALGIFGTHFIDDHRLEEARSGLSVAWFNMESNRNETEAIAKEVNSVNTEASKPSKTNSLPTKEYVKKISALYIYSHHTSSKEPLTDKVRESMSRSAKASASKNLLGRNSNELGRKDGTFGNDEKIFNFATSLSKNASTKKPARLHEPLASYGKSIGQITCGGVQGTCFLVVDKLVITNLHIYMMINTERNKSENFDLYLPITVSFDYLRPNQREQVLSVEVDEEHDPDIENSHLDYKFLRLKENEGLESRRVGLGQFVRSRALQEGRVVIVGYPQGEVMQEETCVVVSNREKLSERVNCACASLHMTNEERLQQQARPEETFPNRLGYDSTLFSGSSGSPVFDLQGHIVAMHTQGYQLDVAERKYSLMQFGVQFQAICEDLRRRHAGIVEQFFPNYNLDIGEEPMDENY